MGSNMWSHALAILLIILLAGLYLYLRIRRNPFNPQSGIRNIPISIESMTEFVKNSLHHLTHSQLSDLGLHEEEYRKRLNKRTELRRALKGCVSGDPLDKLYVKSILKELLMTKLRLSEFEINAALPFDQHERLTSRDKFDIMLYLFKQDFKDQALSHMIEKYQLAEPRILEAYGSDKVYAVTAEDIEYMYANEIRMLSKEEKLDIVVQRIYQHYKGFSVIDEIRDQRIDGVSGGVSGSIGKLPMQQLELNMDLFSSDPAGECESVWLFYKGISLHLGFLSFEQPNELKRVCQNIYKYNHPGQLSETAGYKVNEMKDGSRVVVVRPPFSETWAFFVRKFDIEDVSLEQLIQGREAYLPIGLLAYLMKGSRITAITGAQGSGKTTLLMAMIKYIYATYSIRVQEMSFELQLRKIYSRRNILSFRETPHISGQRGLDLQKKTDGTVNILGEVASDEVASWMIQMSQVASLFTVFTHHAKTFNDLVFSLRNSLLKSGMFQQEEVAEQQVVSVINFDIHLKRDHTGHRYIERITECIPSLKGSFPDSESKAGFQYRNIIEYRDGGYEAVFPISTSSVEEMKGHMQPEDIQAFNDFLHTGWGYTA
ncbi:ATPase, T2SS/T4P/T4SS family [Paenibacillus lemnae]